MKKLIFTLALLILSLNTVWAQKAKTAKSNDVPLIDRSIFFDNPEISGGQLSPDGKFISFQKAHNGIMNIWVKKIEEPFANARRLTDFERPVGGYF